LAFVARQHLSGQLLGRRTPKEANNTLESPATAADGEWVVRRSAGEQWPVPGDESASRYAEFRPIAAAYADNACYGLASGAQDMERPPSKAPGWTRPEARGPGGYGKFASAMIASSSEPMQLARSHLTCP